MTTRIISSAFLMMLISIPAFSQDVNTQLLEAGEKGETSKIEGLLAARAEVDARDLMGVTALMHASAEGHTQSVKALLDAGADVDAHANDGLTALMVVAKGNTEIVRALLDAGADVNAKTDSGVTPLMVAVAMGNLEIVRALLDAGAEVDAKADSGVTALKITERNGYTELNELLKSAGAIATEPRRPQDTLLENESSAIDTVGEIVVAQFNYSATDGEGNYAKTFLELIEAGLIASDLTTGMQNGYQFATSVEGETFTVHADPILPGETGTRHFFADKSGVIRWSIEGPATIFSPGFGESEPGPE